MDAQTFTDDEEIRPEDVAPKKERIDFPRISIADIFSNPSPSVPFVWAGRIPIGHVSLLGAHGGTGKSMLALQLSVAVACGADFLGAATMQGNVLFFSGEDGSGVLRNRLASIATHFNVQPATLAANLTILDATNDPSLYREVSEFGSRSGMNTPGYSRLAEIIEELKPVLIVIDNASDTFEANENDRTHVRRFVRALAKLAHEADAGLLLLAHVNKSSADKGGSESYSGSTGWHNSARSRLAMSKIKDSEQILLEHLKLNLGPHTGEPLRLAKTCTGLLVLANAEPDFSELVKAPKIDLELALITAIADFFEIDTVHPLPASEKAPVNAFRMLREVTALPGDLNNHRRFYEVLRKLEREALVAQEEIRTPDRKWKSVLSLAASAYQKIDRTPPPKSAPTPPDAPAGDAVSEGGETDA
ncbi:MULTISPECIES: AAA family ATPase [Acidithiobacillus]|jgi:archaellum biogenesis ATPase FlaH|uniref:AAA family ATPase n=1 Tax=Acidithiobacillus TaxID=119977 RepID=UPI001C06CD4F|nr:MULTISPECIES: AAA family ATPase [Acidithiobacillus]MBU2749876.1 AAA family ATPase [Acidithiobacillus thiooxidans]MBU2836873.1 AAA family ATPase [Acidithiobacillus thiooxidans]MBU2850767.1 AAA family ATPase [Acidithiobacillus ferrivorans]